MSAVQRHRLAPEAAAVGAGLDRSHLHRVGPADAPYSYNGPSRHVKRVADVTVALILLPLFLPLFVVVGCLIKMTSPGPVLFKQERVGQDGRLFLMRKFRTMYEDAPQRLLADPDLHRQFLANDHKLALGDDPRIAPLGRVLRRSSIDELPQLINVLLGQMSLVGPRPVEADQLGDYGPWMGAYLAMRPGLTGRWQTAGRSDIRFPERAVIDADYLQNWSLRQDAMIMAKTVPCVLRRSGAN